MSGLGFFRSAVAVAVWFVRQFGYAVEIGLCKAKLRRTGTRCPTCDRRCKVDLGIFGYGSIGSVSGSAVS